jgi:hypothetical protein
MLLRLSMELEFCSPPRSSAIAIGISKKVRVLEDLTGNSVGVAPETAANLASAAMPHGDQGIHDHHGWARGGEI